MRGFSFSVFKIPQSKIFSFSLFERFLISAHITTSPKVLICKALSKKPALILDKTVRKSRLVHMAEKEGFEPSRPFRGLHDFQSCALDQLGDFSIIILLFFCAAISACQNSNCYYTRAFLKVKPLFSRFSKKYCNSSQTRSDKM